MAELNITRICRIKDGKLYNILHEQTRLQTQHHVDKKMLPCVGTTGEMSELLLTVPSANNHLICQM